jgi:hypothetical protein
MVWLVSPDDPYTALTPVANVMCREAIALTFRDFLEAHTQDQPSA